ncbi:MAG: carbohydrate ABC transporter permease [Clostridia bacterium]|nr:carbohydrate ABC transporter permease [Clostridia bacterium]
MERSIEKKRKIKSGSVSKKWTPYSVTVGIILALYAASLFAAIAWAFLTSLKGRIEYIRDPISLPKDWLFSNYVEAFEQLSANGKNIFVMFGNSLWLSVLPPTINLFTAAMASYVMAHYKFPGRNLIWSIIIVMMTLPIMGNAAATYKMYLRLGMYNSPLILLKDISNIGGSLLVIAAFQGVSKTYAEAAFLDGAGHFTVFFRVMLPQAMGVLLALWTMNFITCWNDYMTPIMYLPDYTPITSGLYIYQKETERVLNVPILFAGSLMVLVVPVVMFACFQDKFMNLSFGGGIKG